MLKIWKKENLCYSPPLTALEKYLKLCIRNSTALISDLESPINSLWRIVRSGFCLFKHNLDQIGYSDGMASTIIKNITEYNTLLSEYSSALNRSDVTLFQIPNSFYFTIPKLYKLNILPQFLTSVSNYLNFTSDVQKLKFYVDNLNNVEFNWTNPQNTSNVINSNLSLANFTSNNIASVAMKLNLSVFQGYKVINIFKFFLYLLLNINLI